MNNGLTKKDTETLICEFKNIPEIKEAIFFGSRAMGNYKKGSDIDICIKGENITPSITSRLHDILEEEINLPYFFDVINYNSISNKDLKNHIDGVGEKIYTRIEN